MRIKRRWLQITLKFFLMFLLTLLTLFIINAISKTTKFQLFGELVSHVNTPEKVVAFTYDDGPNPPYTNQLLNVLKRHQVKATFFVIGKEVEKHPEIIKQISAQGHEIGNHSYSHQRMVFKNPSFIRTEVEKTDQLLRQLGVTQEIHFRAPYGRKLIVLPYILSQMKKKNILWNISPNDYKASSPQEIENLILQKIVPGSIIVLHDGGGDRKHTVAATDRLIEQLQQKGYTFKTVSELLSYQKKNS